MTLRSGRTGFVGVGVDMPEIREKRQGE